MLRATNFKHESIGIIKCRDGEYRLATLLELIKAVSDFAESYHSSTNRFCGVVVDHMKADPKRFPVDNTELEVFLESELAELRRLRDEKGEWLK
jgi:hypothetical protein